MPFYYPNWINDFWRIMGLIHFADKDHFCIPAQKRFDESAIRDFCTREGLAFYDTACEIRRLRDNASDAFLEVVTPTDIPALLRQIPDCHAIVTTGQKATEILVGWLAPEPYPANLAKRADRSLPLPPVGGFIDTSIDTSIGIHIETNVDSHIGPSISTHINTRVGPRPIRFWRMPSTSRAYPLPLEKKAEAYRRLFILP